MKSSRILGIGLLAVIPFLTLKAQKAMTPQDLQDWKRITTRAISDDGQWTAAIFTPWKGDSEVQLLSVDGKAVQSYTPASEVKFSSSYAIVKKVPADALMDELKLKKTKKDKMPMDELIIRNLKSGTEWSIDSLKGYKLAENGEWLAYQRTRKDSSLVVVSLDGTQKFVLPSASAYGFAKEKAALYFVTKEDKDGKKPGMYIWTAEKPQPILIKEGKGLFVQPAFDKAGSKLAFLYTDNKKEKDYTMALWVSENAGEAREIVNRTTAGLPEGWVVSPNQRLTKYFKKNRHGIRKVFSLGDWWHDRKTWQKTVMITSICLLLVVSILATVVFTVFDYNYNKITENPDDLGFTDVIDDKIINIALFGIDTRDIDSFEGLSDSIMILSLNTETKTVKIISIMRDTLISMEQNGKTIYNKINSAYLKGGPVLAIKTINSNFGLDISEYATVNFFGMAEIIDAVGGVDVELTKSEISGKNDINFCLTEICEALGKNPKQYMIHSAGKKHLNGIQAVAYSRIRYVANIWGTNNDHGRTDRQRHVMEQLFQKALTLDKSKY